MAKLREGSAVKQILDEKNAPEAFWLELDHICLDKGLKPGAAAISTFAGVSDQTIRQCRQGKIQLRLDTMQQIVKKLKPDIRVTLKLIGYTDSDIRKFAKEAAGNAN